MLLLLFFSFLTRDTDPMN